LENDAAEKPDIPAEDVAALKDLTSTEFAEKLVDMYKSANTQAKTSASTGLIEDKATRSKIHQVRLAPKKRTSTRFFPVDFPHRERLTGVHWHRK